MIKIRKLVIFGSLLSLLAFHRKFTSTPFPAYLQNEISSFRNVYFSIWEYDLHISAPIFCFYFKKKLSLQQQFIIISMNIRVISLLLLSLFAGFCNLALGQMRFHTICSELGLKDDEVKCIWTDSSSHRVCFATSKATFCLNGSRFSPISKPDVLPQYSTSIAIDDFTCSITDNNGIVLTDSLGNTVRHITRNDNFPFSLPTNHLTCIHRDIDGYVWIGTSKGGIAVFHPRDFQMGMISTTHKEDIPCFWQTNDSTLWIGYDGKGIEQIDLSGKKIRSFDTTNSCLINNAVVGVCDTGKDGFYLSTFGGGVVQMLGDSLIRPSWSNIESIACARKMAIDVCGNIWIGSVRFGLTRIAPDGSHTLFNYDNSPMNTSAVTDVCLSRNGNLLVATSTGLCVVSSLSNNPEILNARSSEPESSLATLKITCMHEDHRGVLWIGSDNGILAYRCHSEKPNVFTLISAADADNRLKVVRAIAEDKAGNIWITTDRDLQRVCLRSDKSGNYKIVSTTLLMCDDDISFAKYSLKCLPSGMLVAGCFGKVLFFNPGFDENIAMRLMEFDNPHKSATGQSWLFVVMAAILALAVILLAFAVVRQRRHRAANVAINAYGDVNGSSEQFADAATKEFIEKARNVVLNNIADADFSVEDFARELLVSRSALYKKLMATTGVSPIEFMRDIRISRGYEMISREGCSVSEAAYAVGMSPKQFSRFFKEKYGSLPSQIVKK